MEKNLHSIESIEQYLDGTHPEPNKFKDAMKFHPELSAEVALQRQIAEAFSDPKKNELRNILAGLNEEFAQKSEQKSAIIVHFSTWTRQYLAAAAVLAFAVFGFVLLNQRNQDAQNTAKTEQEKANPTPQPNVETPAPNLAPKVENMATAPQKPVNSQPQTPKTQTGLAVQPSKVEVQNVYLPAEITRGSDGAAQLQLTADVVLKNGFEGLEEVEVRLVSREKNQTTVSEQFALREERAVGYVKNSPPSKMLEVETSVPLAAGEYDLQLVLPDGDVIFTGRILVKDTI